MQPTYVTRAGLSGIDLIKLPFSLSAGSHSAAFRRCHLFTICSVHAYCAVPVNKQQRLITTHVQRHHSAQKAGLTSNTWEAMTIQERIPKFYLTKSFWMLWLCERSLQRWNAAGATASRLFLHFRCHNCARRFDAPRPVETIPAVHHHPHRAFVYFDHLNMIVTQIVEQLP